MCGYTLHAGDLCLVSKRKFDGKHKIADRWEPGTYTVVTKAPGALVYEVEPVDGGPRLKLHRNHLLPLAGRVRDRALSPVTDPEKDGETTGDKAAGEEEFRDALDLPPDRSVHGTDGGTYSSPPKDPEHSESEESSYEDAQEDPEPKPPLRRSKRMVRAPKRYQQAVFVLTDGMMDWPSVEEEHEDNATPRKLKDVFPRQEPRRPCSIVPR